MTIEIKQPELEALILERMQQGAFPTVEDALLQALKSSPAPSEKGASGSSETSVAIGASLVAAMQASPYKDCSLEPMRNRPRVRDVAL